MRLSRSLQGLLFVLVVGGSLVLINILGLRAFKREDLTRDRMYTLSPATRETLGSLEDPVTVTAYFTDNLPAPYLQNARYVRDLLDEYRAASHGKLAFEFVDPAKQESEKDKEKKREIKRDVFGREYREQTAMEKELAQSGLQAVQLTVVEEDQRQTKLAYMGLVLKYLDKREVIPVVQGTDTLEYDLTSLIKKMTRKKAPVIALAAPAPAPQGGEGLASDQLKSLFDAVCTVKPIQLDAITEIPADADALFVVAPEKPVPEAAQRAIDAFLQKGKSVAFLLDVAKPELRSFSVTPVDHGLTPLLASYGVGVGDSLVADVQCAQLNVQEERGFMRVAVPVHYPFIPIVPKLEGDSALTRGLTQLNFPFVTSLSLTPQAGLTETVLAQTGTQSWLEKKPFNTDPRRDWRDVQPSFGGPYPVMVEVTGRFKSHFGGQTGAADARVIVAGGASLAANPFLAPANQALLLNLADFLMLDQGMLAMRTRGLSEPPLKPALSENVRTGVKWGNALGIPFVLCAFGLVRWLQRERRRSTITV